MIGQNNNKQLVKKWRESNTFPPFIIITGEKGSGKKTLARYIAGQIGGYVIEPGNKVDNVRDAVENSYKCSAKTTYIFSDTEKMSVQAKNALLKVTEEPPRRAYFILTAEDSSSILPTLISRGTKLSIENYTREELEQFTTDKLILDIAQTPGEIQQLFEMNVKEYIQFVEKVLYNIGKVSGVNAFKIANSFKFKDTDEKGYNVPLFLSTLSSTAYNSIEDDTPNEDVLKYAKTIKLCLECKREFSLTGVKKDSTFDMFILDLRDVWKGAE